MNSVCAQRNICLLLLLLLFHIPFLHWTKESSPSEATIRAIRDKHLSRMCECGRGQSTLTNTSRNRCIYVWNKPIESIQSNSKSFFSLFAVQFRFDSTLDSTFSYIIVYIIISKQRQREMEEKNAIFAISHFICDNLLFFFFVSLNYIGGNTPQIDKCHTF